VTIEHEENGDPVYLVRMPGRGEYRFGADQIIHRRALNLLNPYGRGGGAGLAVADEIESDEYASKWVKGYFLNGTKPEYIMSIPGATQDQAKQVRTQITERHQGFDRAWHPYVTGTDVKIIELTRKLGDERIAELRKNWQNIIRWVYGVPPEVIGDVDNSNRATAQEAEQLMGKFVTGPRARDYRDSMMAEFGEEFNADLDNDSPAPKAFDRQDEIMSRHSWSFTRNEIRQSAGKDAVPDGDVYAVPANLVEVPQGRRVVRIIQGGKQ
jgi:phage portal protein BeeE